MLCFWGCLRWCLLVFLVLLVWKALTKKFCKKILIIDLAVRLTLGWTRGANGTWMSTKGNLLRRYKGRGGENDPDWDGRIV